MHGSLFLGCRFNLEKKVWMLILMKNVFICVTGVLHNGMSLFQDLKLKRRKVDSRCSSDGESIGTSDSASSLSPEAQIQNEGSPKDKDR